MHISIATVHFVDYLLTWNNRHIANPEIQARISEHFQRQGFSCLSFAHQTNSWEKRMTDSIIKEVRAIRERHAASFGFDLDRIFADLEARQIKHAAEVWTIIPAPDSPPTESDLA